MLVSFKDCFRKYEQYEEFHSYLGFFSHLLQKSLKENLCTVEQNRKQAKKTDACTVFVSALKKVQFHTSFLPYAPKNDTRPLLD